MFQVNNNQRRTINPKRARKSSLTIDQKKKLAIAGLVVAIILIITITQIRKNNSNYNNLKADKSQYIVYTKYSKTGTYSKAIPYLNMKADVMQKVNEDIDLFCEPYKTESKSVITYDYDINGIILSLAVKIVDNDTGYAPEAYFRTYNINLDTEQVISDDALLQFFNVTQEQVAAKIQDRFEKFYRDILDEQYFVEEECNYECFLKYREVSDYLDDIHYYVDDGKLVVYKPFIYTSMFGEENYFKDSDFIFEIADAPATN